MRLSNLEILKNKHFLALIGNGIISVVSVLNMALIYRAMDKAHVGMWFFFVTVYALSDAIRNGFLSTATVKFYAGTEKARAKEVLGSVWFLAIAITLAFALISLAALPFLGLIQSEGTLIVIKWFAITCISALPYTVTFWILVADERYLAILWLRLVNNGITIVAISVFIYLNQMSLQKLLIINVVTNSITSLASILARYTQFKTFFSRTTTCIKELANYGKYSLATNLSSNLLSSADTFILNIFLGPAAVAVYTLPLRLMEFVEIPLRSFIGTGMSGMATAFNKNDMARVADIFKKYSGMLTWLFIPMAILAFFFADFAIGLLGGGKYVNTEAPVVYRLFMIMAILYPIDRFNGVTLDIIHLPKINFYKVLVMLASCVTTDLIGVYFTKSIYGVAFASPFTLLSGILVGYFALRKHVNYSFGEVFRYGYAECVALIKAKVISPFSKKS